MATSTLTYSQDMSSSVLESQASDGPSIEFGAEFSNDDTYGIEFDLREPEDVGSEPGLLIDEPPIVSEAIMELSDGVRGSSPRKLAYDGLEVRNKIVPHFPRQLDVSKLVDSLVGDTKILGLDKMSSSTSAYSKPVANSILPVPKPMAVARSPLRRQLAEKELKQLHHKARKDRVDSGSLSDPGWRNVFKKGWVCPDGWIPRHECDEFCYAAFRAFS